MKRIKKQPIKKLDNNMPGIFDELAEYLLKKQKEKDNRNQHMIVEHFNRCLK